MHLARAGFGRHGSLVSGPVAIHADVDRSLDVAGAWRPLKRAAEGAILRKPLAFISYRRSDSFVAGDPDHSPFLTALDAALQQLGFDTFLDVRQVFGGERFDNKIVRQIAECDLFIPLIGPNWLDEMRSRMRVDAEDLAAREVRAAFKLDRDIVPILIDDAAMPAAADLRPELVDLAYLDAESLSSSAGQAEIAALFEPIAERVRSVRRLGRGWVVGYAIFAVLAYLFTAVVPNAVGLAEFGEAWFELAATWGALFLWPVIFLPFSLIALRQPIRTMHEAYINARKTSDRITYATPLLVAIGVSFLSIAFEVPSTYQSPWGLSVRFEPGRGMPDCGETRRYASRDLSGLVRYDARNELRERWTSNGQIPPFWLENKCWPNVYFYLVSPALTSDQLRQERSQVQRLFVSALRTTNYPRSGVSFSYTFWAYVASFSILIFLGSYGVAMAAFFASANLRRAEDDRILLRPSEEGYLCLTYAFVTLLVWVPLRMITVYSKHLYYCENLSSCSANPSIFLTDWSFGFVLLIGYAFVTTGLFRRFKRIGLGFLSIFCVTFILAIAWIVYYYGEMVSGTNGIWQFYLAVTIPSIYIMMALWFQFNPSVVRFNDFKRGLAVREP
ncbi:MAG TPA: toll/interleukin-1 receptor domain-containing protein [Allosphingosinicella sp.]|nr:toll/interleukin-1 receptor domain-containing protein [Allosphingosinicella sp.]